MKPIVFPKLAVNKIAPPAFEVQPPADVSSRDEAMQRKASAMHQISAQDVYEFMEKVAAEDRWKKDSTSPAGKKNIQNQNMFEKNYNPRYGGTVTYAQDTRGEGYGDRGVIETRKYPTSFSGNVVTGVDKYTLQPNSYAPYNGPVNRIPSYDEVTTNPYYNVP